MKKRIQVTINPELLVEAQRLLKARKFDNLSNFLESLIRQEWERQHPSFVSPAPSPAEVSSGPKYTDSTSPAAVPLAPEIESVIVESKKRVAAAHGSHATPRKKSHSSGVPKI